MFAIEQKASAQQGEARYISGFETSPMGSVLTIQAIEVSKLVSNPARPK